MKALSLLLLAPLAVLAAPAQDVNPRQATQSIDTLMKAKGKLYFGTCSDQGRLSAGKNAAIIDANFGQLTPENSLKWESTESTKGKFTFAQADYLVNWVRKKSSCPSYPAFADALTRAPSTIILGHRAQQDRPWAYLRLALSVGRMG